MDYDVIVIGGGSAGLMAAVAAGERGERTLLLEKGGKLGTKLSISGGGRCNVTNAGSIESIIRNIPGNGKFLYSPFSVFNNQDIIRFFEGLGIALKEEDRGRMFPVSNRAQDVVRALVRKVREVGVEIWLKDPVERLLYDGGRVVGVRTRAAETLSTSSAIVAVGGMSVPRTGSTGDGYAWALAAGHTLTERFPTEVPITSNESFIRDHRLQGLSLRDIALSVLHPKNGKKWITHEGDLLFTHFGLSGPTALRCSQFVVTAMRQYPVQEVYMVLDLFPAESLRSLTERWIQSASAEEPRKHLKNFLRGLLPERFAAILLEKLQVAGHLTLAQVGKPVWQQLASLCKAFPVTVNGTLSLAEAFVTGGGVDLKEIDPRSMQSKLMAGLYFCGEILDVHGYTGGYNITAAFSTGYTAGKAAAQASLLRHDR